MLRNALVRRMSQTKTATSSSVGPNDSARICHRGLASGCLACTSTSLRSSSASRWVSSNEGRSVWKRRMRVPEFPGSRIGLLRAPSISSPIELTLRTFPDLTSARNTV